MIMKAVRTNCHGSALREVNMFTLERYKDAVGKYHHMDGNSTGSLIPAEHAIAKRANIPAESPGVKVAHDKRQTTG